MVFIILHTKYDSQYQITVERENCYIKKNKLLLYKLKMQNKLFLRIENSLQVSWLDYYPQLRKIT